MSALDMVRRGVTVNCCREIADPRAGILQCPGNSSAPRQRRRDEGGTVPLELVVIAPMLAVLLSVLVFTWRVSEAGNQVTAAAAEAARAASLERDVEASATAGQIAAERTLDDRGLSCADLDVSIDVSSYEPGGYVKATVRCTADLQELDVPGAPGRWTEEASFTEPIEQFRGG